MYLVWAVRQDTDKTESAGAPGDTMEVDTPSEVDDDEEMLVFESEGRTRNGTGHAHTGARCSGRATRSSTRGDERARYHSATDGLLRRLHRDPTSEERGREITS